MMSFDVLSQLLIASWRGLGFPCSGREYGFRHEQAKHRYVFVDDELIESLGRENPSYSYTIPGHNGLAKGPWNNWFSNSYGDFLNACLDRTTGSLVDPVHGETDAKCVSLRETLDVNRRDGVDIVAEFVYAPQDVTVTAQPIVMTSTEGAKGMAGALDREIKKIDWKQELPPEPTLDLFDAVRGIGDQIDLAKNRVSAQMANLASKMELLSDRIESLNDPETEPVRRNARKLALAAYRLHEQATTPPNPTKIVVLTRDIGLISLAALYKMSVSDLQKLNPTLGRSPTVASGTAIRVNRTK
jgi:prophage DNA circulation protein